MGKKVLLTFCPYIKRFSIECVKIKKKKKTHLEMEIALSLAMSGEENADLWEDPGTLFIYLLTYFLILVLRLGTLV